MDARSWLRNSFPYVDAARESRADPAARGSRPAFPRTFLFKNARKDGEAPTY